MTTNITAGLVKDLRERTGAGMMECKKALVATNGDIELAVEELRKSGAAKADKKSGRTAADGAVAIVTAADGKCAAMLEINSETDFVARDTNFVSYVNAVAETAMRAKTEDVAALSALPLFGNDSQTVEEARQALVTKVGENIQIRRVVISDAPAGTVGSYTHSGRIGVTVVLDVDNNELARDIAMHIAASRPLVVSPENVPQEVVEKEKEIYTAQAASSGKPAEIIEKMVLGKLKKYLDEVSLIGQPFVKDPDISIGSLLNKHRAKVVSFNRYEVGEGIEKVVEDFRESVMAQIQSS